MIGVAALPAPSAKSADAAVALRRPSRSGAATSAVVPESRLGARSAPSMSSLAPGLPSSITGSSGPAWPTCMGAAPTVGGQMNGSSRRASSSKSPSGPVANSQWK